MNHSLSEFTGSPRVFLVDPDPVAREAVCGVATGLNLECEIFESGSEFLDSQVFGHPGCAVLEVGIPGVSGLQVQQQLVESGCGLPLVFLSAREDVSLAVEVMRRGAVNFLVKPPRGMELWAAIEDAIQVDRQRREAQEIYNCMGQALSELKPRELALLRMLAEGASNRDVAATEGVSVRTIELDRSRIMRRFELRSPTALMHFALLAHPEGAYARLNGRWQTTRRTGRDRLAQERSPANAAEPMRVPWPLPTTPGI